MVKLTIDGQAVQVPEGTLLVQAAKEIGIDIPVFCYHDRMKPFAACRMCLVDIEKMPKLQTACSTPVAEGMVVHTQNEKVIKAREGVLEFTLVNHPLDCPICDKGGECMLQDHTFEHAAPKSRFVDEKVHKNKAVPLGPLVMLDQERCIICQRCIRFQDEVAGDPVLTLLNRGNRSVVDTYNGRVFDDRFSGNTIEMCPVGALTSRPFRFVARPWDLRSVPTICSQCPVGCNVTMDVRDAEVMRLLSRDNEQVDRGWLCDRGQFGYGFLRAEGRIAAPMVRQDGQLVEVSWREAIETARSGLSGRAERSAVLGGARGTTEAAALLAQVSRDVMGTRHVDHRLGLQKIVTPPGPRAAMADLEQAHAVLILETNPWESAPVLGLRLRRVSMDHGVKTFLFNAAPTGIPVPSQRVSYRPGELARTLADIAAALGKATSDADPNLGPVVEALRGEGTVVMLWDGRDVAAAGALSVLLQTREHLGLGKTAVLIPGEEANSRGAELAGLIPGEGGLDAAGSLAKAANGELDALLIWGHDLYASYPDAYVVDQALAATPFVVVADTLWNEAARQANVVLPLAAFAETDGMLVNLDGRLQAQVAGTPPYAESKPDWWVASELIDLHLVRVTDVRKALAATLPLFGKTPGRKGVVVVEDGPVFALVGASGAVGSSQDGLRLITEQLLYTRGYGPEPFLAELAPRPKAYLNPLDAARLGLHDGGWVRLQGVAVAASGADLVAEVHVAEDVVQGSVYVPWGAKDLPLNRLPYQPFMAVQLEAVAQAAIVGEGR